MKEEFNTKFYFYIRVNGACSIYSLEEFSELNITLCQVQLPGNLVTICIIADDKGNTARGLSVFSINDSFVLEVGMNDAECKAIRAIKGRKLEKEYSDKRAIRVLVGVRCPYTLPAERNPELSLFERRLLFGKKFMEKKEVNWTEMKYTNDAEKMANYYSGKYRLKEMQNFSNGDIHYIYGVEE